MSEPENHIERLRDFVARDAEHSHVSGEARRRISAIADELLHASETGVVQTEEIADAVVNRLEDDQLAEIVWDWLESQMVI